MANTIQIVIKQTATGNGISSTIKELGGLDSKISGSVGSLGKLGSTFTGLGAGILKFSGLVAGIGFAGLVTGLGGAAVAGFRFNNSMEQASAKINAFTKDADLTAKILKDVKLEAAKTPFEFDQMASSVSGLLPAAKQADVGIMDLLKDAEVLAASNPAEGLEGAAFALREAVSGDFTSVIERFNLPRTMINDLKEQGVPALEIVRTAMKNMGYDMDLVTALANTAEGRWSTFKDTLTNLAGTVTQPLFDALSGGLGGVNDYLTSITPQLEAFANMLAGQVSGAITGIITAITKVSGAFSRFGVRGATVSILGQLGLDQSQIGGIMGVVDQITEAISKIQGAFNRFGLKGATVSILGMLGMDPETIGLIRTTFDTVVSTITEKFGILQAVYAQFGAMGAGVSLLSMLGLSSESIALVTTSIQAITDGFTNLSIWWVTNWPVMQAVALTAWEVIQSIFNGIVVGLTPVVVQLQATFTQLGASFSEVGVLLNNLGINWSTVFAALLQATGIVAAGVGAALLGVIGVLVGVVSGVAGGVDAMIQTFMALWTQVGVIFDGMGLILSGWIGVISALIAGDFAGAWLSFGTVIQGAYTMWQGFISSLLVVATGAFNVIIGTVGGFVDGVVGFFQGMYDALIGNSIIPDLVNGIVKWFKDLPQKIVSGLGNLTSTVIKPFQTMATTIKEEVGESFKTFTDDIIPAFVKGFEFVTDGVENFISSIQHAATTLADMVIPDWLQMHSPPPLAQALTMSADAASKATAGLASMQKQMITSTSASHNFIDSLDMGQFKGIGGGIGGGAWRGLRTILKQNISGSMGALADGLSPGDIMGQVTSTAQQWRIPPEYAQSIAEANGLVEHLTSTFEVFKKQMNIENLGNMMQMAGSFSSLGSGFADMLTEQMGSTEAAKKTVDTYRKLTTTLSTQGKELSALQDDLAILTDANKLDNAAIEKKQKAIEKLTEEMQKNKVAMDQATTAFDALATGSTNDQIAFLQAFLGSGQDTMAASDAIWDKVSAQDELNRLLEEQARQETLITAQKESQQKLDFLKSQLDLIKLGQGLGGDIFKGIKFGLDASTEDLLAATNAIVDAMVGQINTDLQMASPSKLLFKMFKDNVGGAMVGGLMAVKPLMQGAIAPVLDPIMAGAQAAGKVVNNYFNQTVNTQANQSSVIGDFRTMQLMAGA